MNRQLAGCAAAAALLIGIAWLATSGGGISLTARLRGAVTVPPGEGAEAPLKTGTSPGRYRPAWDGPGGRRMVRRHPRSASPGITARQMAGYDWMFCPPSEEDL